MPEHGQRLLVGVVERERNTSLTCHVHWVGGNWYVRLLIWQSPLLPHPSSFTRRAAIPYFSIVTGLTGKLAWERVQHLPMCRHSLFDLFRIITGGLASNVVGTILPPMM